MRRHFISNLLFPAMLGAMTVSADARELSAQDNANGGYYLLHKLCTDEAQLPLLMTVKDTPKEIESFADKISRTAKETLSMLDRLKEHDKSLDFDANPLPKIEQDVRDSIKGEKQHQLLFGATGSDFARAVLVSQSEASTYGENLAKVLADNEKDPDRAKALRHISQKWAEIRTQTYALMRHY